MRENFDVHSFHEWTDAHTDEQGESFYLKP